MEKDLQEVAACTCLLMRRATRRMTQIYEHALEPAGVTVNQFGILAHLYAGLARTHGLSIGVISERLGTDPTTLNRTLTPLQMRGLVRNAIDSSDGRVRLVRITDEGQRALAKAIPLWRQAKAKVEHALGSKSMRALNEMLESSNAKLTHSG
jgi:DNA-binding MarR family transcriptional regulator